MAAVVNYYPAVGSNVTSAATALTRARSLLGTSITTVFGNDFEAQDWYTGSVVSSGTIAVSAVDKAGVAIVSSGASANSSGQIRPVGSPSWIDNPKTSPWYVVMRYQFATAINNTARLSVGMAGVTGGSPQILYGIVGSTSTANTVYEVYNDAGGTVVAPTTTSVAIDPGTWHTFELWNDLTNLNWANDGTTVATNAVTSMGTNPMSFAVIAANGATAAARTIKVDYVWFCCVGN